MSTSDNAVANLLSSDDDDTARDFSISDNVAANHPTAVLKFNHPGRELLEIHFSLQRARVWQRMYRETPNLVEEKYVHTRNIREWSMLLRFTKSKHACTFIKSTKQMRHELILYFIHPI